MINLLHTGFHDNKAFDVDLVDFQYNSLMGFFRREEPSLCMNSTP